MAFREGWIESVKGVTRIALSLYRLGTRPVAKLGGKTGGKISGFQSLQHEWARKRVEEDARLRAELQRIRGVLVSRSTIAK